MNLRKRKLNENCETNNLNDRSKLTPKKSTKTNDNKKFFNLIDYLNEPEWIDLLKDEFDKDYFKEINKFLNTQYRTKNIKPPIELVFNAFNLTKLSQVNWNF